MKIPLDNGNQNDGSGGGTNASASGADSGSDTATGIERTGIVGELGAGSGAIDDGSDELPLGDGNYKRRFKRSKKSRSGSVGAGVDTLRIGGRGSSRGGGGRSETDSNSSSANARSDAIEEKTPSGDSSIPREVALDSLGKPKEKKEKFSPNGSLTTEFIAEGFGIVFHTFAILLNDDEWKLPHEDATELADRAKRWAKQGSKSAAALEKKLAKYEPMMMLIFGLFAVILPRIISTRNKRNALRIQAKAAAASNANGASAPASVQSDNGANVGGSAARPENGSASVIPFRRADGFEFFGKADQ